MFIAAMKNFLKIVLVSSFFASAANAAALPSPVDFVKSFYASLTAAQASTSLGRTEKLKNYFDDNLYQLLLDDDKNRAIYTDKICGFLNFDALTNSQDGDATLKNVELLKTVPVFVLAVSFDPDPKAALFMQLKQVNGAWKITDLLYPDLESHRENKSLLSLLATVHQESCTPPVADSA